ncbi:hypothetical protein Tco_0386408 [Tanacetum coccineum]
MHKDLAFDDLDDDAMDYMETEDAQDKGRTSSVVLEEKERQTKRKWVLLYVLSSQMEVFDKRNKVLQARLENKQKEKEKGVEIRNVEDTKRTKSTSTRSMLTLKPLPKIDPKDKGKKMIDEEDEVVARKVQKNGKLKRKEIEREKFTIKQRAKFLHDTIATQRKFLAQQRSEAIRNKPPTINQLRNQMMTYLKHVGGKKHSELKTKTFEEIQVLYERLKRQDQNFVAIGSAEDERQIKEMNEESKDPEKKRLKKRVVNEEDTTKVPAKQEATEQGTKKRKSGHVKMIARKRPRAR